MASVNRAILIGNLGRDPDLRYTPSGQPVAKFPIATSERWKDKDGQLQQRTDWHNIVAWGRQAEVCKEYLKKGSPVYIEGRIQSRSYEDKDGNRKYITEIVANRMQMLGRKEEGPSEEEIPPEPETEEAEGDDIPF
ncbi:MAG TPA: single-stranded DNA-binding protein [candidate division Zixibacteria bacterium]